MFIILAIICFLIAYLEHGAVISVSTAWFDSTGLLYLGLTFLAVHLIRIHGGPGNWRTG